MRVRVRRSTCSKKIGESPWRFGAYEGKHLRRKYRRALVERFPYIIFYQVRDEEILVVAVAHTSREPGYWEKPSRE